MDLKLRLLEIVFFAFFYFVVCHCQSLNLYDHLLISAVFNIQRLWNISTAKFIKTYTGHTNSQYCISSAFSFSNGKRIISGSEDKCVYMWELNSKKMLQKLEGHTETVTTVTSHPTENLIASGSLDKSIRIWTQKKE